VTANTGTADTMTADTGSGAAGASTEGTAPVIRFTRGQPTDTEVAAVVSVLLAASAAGGPEPTSARDSVWAARSRVRAGLGRPGPDAWRVSGWGGGSGLQGGDGR
jgi:hypothetical protein